MGGKRTTPPLFELLRDAEAKADRSARLGAARDAAIGRPKPAPPKRPEPPKPKKNEKKADSREPWRLDSTKRVAVPLNAILVGSAIFIAIGVTGLAITWKMGFMGGKQESRRVLNSLAPTQQTLIDPLVKGMPVSDGLIGDDPPDEVEAPPPQQVAGGAYLVAGGALDVDPRKGGDNYLMIASKAAQIDQAQARRLTSFFQVNGLEVVCVPVDLRAGGSNNPGYYDVFVLQGVPGDQFSARRNEREDLERRVAQLGQIWKREHDGTTSFQSPQWTKHTP